MLLKAVISGLIIAAASEAARRSPHLGGFILSLPVVSVLTFLWMWRESGDREMIAQLSDSVFWFFLPTLPMFAILPLLLRSGMGFLAALAIVVGLTVCLYGGMLWLAPHVGLRP